MYIHNIYIYIYVYIYIYIQRTNQVYTEYACVYWKLAPSGEVALLKAGVGAEMFSSVIVDFLLRGQ